MWFFLSDFWHRAVATPTSQRRRLVDKERERERERSFVDNQEREREIYEERYSIMAGSRASPGVHTTRGISIAILAWQGLSLDDE
jgi:hypothetical protein